MAELAEIWRHPIKSHGRERLQEIFLEAGKTLPFDRYWAVAHEESAVDQSQWSPCQNFSRCAKTAALQAIDAEFEEKTGLLTLTHPKLAPLRFDPDREIDRFLDWLHPITDLARAKPSRLIRVEGRGMTDTDYPSVSFLSIASHQAVESHFGKKLTRGRWRGNFWLEGLEAWQEEDWPERQIKIGNALFEITERIIRCSATMVDTASGEKDVDMLRGLSDMRDAKTFGVYARVVTSGHVKPGDQVELL